MFSFINLVLIVLGTVYIALIYNSMAFMLLTFMEVVLLVVSVSYLCVCKLAIRGKIEIPVGISEAGKENMVKIVLTNNKRFTVARMKAIVVVEDTITSTKKKSWMKLTAIPFGTISVTNNVTFPGTGNYNVILKKLRIYDITGIFYMDKKVNSLESVSIAPKICDVSVKLSEPTKNFYGEADVYDENSPGHDKSGIFQVREYQKGDRLQNIHWKMTAKQDELMVKEHLLPKSCPIVFLLDFQPIKKSKKNRIEIAFLEAAVSISFSMMDAGCAHYIVWYDKEEKDIKRIRVDDEESLFFFMDMLMKIRWEHNSEDLLQRYKEKYRNEPYVWSLSLDENLVLKRDEEVISQFSEKNIEESLSEVELFL